MIFQADGYRFRMVYKGVAGQSDMSDLHHLDWRA